jgi:hypothetical protein
MGGKKKGLSLEEKRQKLLEVYYEKVFNHLNFHLFFRKKYLTSKKSKSGALRKVSYYKQ